LDQALADDPALRARFEEIAAHLLRYDHLPPAPPPPPFSVLDAALDAEVDAALGQPDSQAQGVASKRHPLDALTPALSSPDLSSPDLRILDLQPRAPGRLPRKRLRWGAFAAAAALVAVALWSPWRDGAGTRQARSISATGLTFVPGPGLALIRAGRSLPAPARALRDLRPGDELRCQSPTQSPTEAHLAGRVRVVLDGGAALRIGSGSGTSGASAADSHSVLGTVRLLTGRAWFEVAPGAFEVHTPYGVVRVLGTAFEVDLRAGRLDVSVAHGRVSSQANSSRAGSSSAGPSGQELPSSLPPPVEIAAGWGLSEGRLTRLAGPAGAWFQRPRLLLTRAGTGPLASTLTRGTPLRLDLSFANPGQVPVRLRGPGAVRTAVWISFETPEGRTVAEMPVLPANVVAGQALLEPGASAELAPGQRRVLTIEILPPVGSPGAYRCRALYRPEGQPAVLSDPLDLEVR